MFLLLFISSAFSLTASIPNYKCDGDMSVTYAKRPDGAVCIEVPIEPNGEFKDLTDYKIDKGAFVIDTEKRDARLAAEAALAQKEAERAAIIAKSESVTLSKEEQDELIKFLVNELIKGD